MAARLYGRRSTTATVTRWRKKHSKFSTKIDYLCSVASSELDYGSKHIFKAVVFNNLKLEEVKKKDPTEHRLAEKK